MNRGSEIMSAGDQEAEYCSQSTQLLLDDDDNYLITVEQERLAIAKDGVGLSLRSFLGSSLLSVNGAGISAAVFLTVNAALGAGLLNFSYAFNQAGGILVGFTMQMVLVFFITGSILILSYCHDVTKCTTYQDVVLYFCGQKVYQACAIMLILYSFGSCLTYLILIGDQFDRVFASLFGSTFCHYWYMNRSFTMAASGVLFILPLCFSKTIDFLKYASSVGVLATIYIVFMIIYEYFISETTMEPKMKSYPDHWTDVFLIVPVICFAYQCHLSWIPTYAAMSDHSQKSLLLTVFISFLILLVAYTICSIFGYMTFGSLVASDLIQSYDATKPVVLIGIVMLAIKTLTCYPIMLFCAREAVDEMYCKFREYDHEEAAMKEPIRRVTIVIIWFIISIMISVGIPGLGIAVQFLGSLAAIFLFIFPGWCLLKAALMNDHHLVSWSSRFLTILSALYLSLGAGVFGESLTHCVLNAVQQMNSPMEEIQLCT